MGIFGTFWPKEPRIDEKLSDKFWMLSSQCCSVRNHQDPNVWEKKTPWNPPCFGHISTCRPEPGGGGRNQVQAGTKSGTQGFESLVSVIKNWLKISWSILSALQNIFSLQICGQFIRKKKNRNCNLFSPRASQNKPIKSGKFGIMMFW